MICGGGDDDVCDAVVLISAGLLVDGTEQWLAGRRPCASVWPLPALGLSSFLHQFAQGI